MRIYKDFHFEAAHFLPSAAPGTANARIHGHSFRARVVIDGEPSEETGYVFHFDELASQIAEAREALDHRLLNEVDGLSTPTLERIAMWLWSRCRTACRDWPRFTSRAIHATRASSMRGPRGRAGWRRSRFVLIWPFEK